MSQDQTFLFARLDLELEKRIVKEKMRIHFSKQVLCEMCDIVTELNLLRANLLSLQFSAGQTSLGECALDEWYETFTDTEIMTPEDRVQLENLDRHEYFSSISLTWHLEDNVWVWQVRGFDAHYNWGIRNVPASERYW